MNAPSSTQARARSIAALAAAFVVLALVAHPAFVAPAGAAVGDCTPSPSWGTPRPDLAARVVQLVNEHRAQRGLVTLATSGSLASAAVWKARHMAAYAYMAHDDPAPPVARTTQQRLDACGYPTATSRWGENLGHSYATAEAVMDRWLASPAHRGNIENPSFRAIGVGAAASSGGTIYWAQAFGSATAGSTPPPPPPSPPPPPPPPPPLPPPPPPAPPAPPPPPPPPPPLPPPPPPPEPPPPAPPPPAPAPSPPPAAADPPAAPAVPSAPATSVLAVKRVAIAPSRLRATRRATVVLVLGIRAPAETALRCRARVGRTRPRLVERRVAASTTGTRAVCTWRLRRGMSGRLFRATVRVTAGQATATRRVTRRIA